MSPEKPRVHNSQEQPDQADDVRYDTNELEAVQETVGGDLRHKISDEQLDRLLKHPAVRAELALGDEERAERDERRRRSREKLLKIVVNLVDENGRPDSEKVDEFLLENPNLFKRMAEK